MHKRSLLFVFAPILAVVLVAVLLYAVRSSSQPPPITLDDTSAASATAIPAKPVAAPPLAQPAPATATPNTAKSLVLPPTPTQDAGLVALVNGEIIGVEDFALALAVDQVMSKLLGTQPATPEQLVEQLVNHRLVAQQMADGSPATAVDAGSQLAALLDSVGKTPADLTDALDAAGVKRTEFDQYFSDLLAVQEFARQAAATQGRAVDAYVTGLQTAAHISYGPAAALITQAAVPTPPASQAATGSAVTTLFSPIAESIAQQAVAEVAQPSSTVTAETSVISVTPTTLIASATLVASAPITGETRGLEVGQLGPDFALTTFGDAATKVAASNVAERQTTFNDLLGQPVVLSFWTTWCPYCLRQTPVLVAAAEQYTGSIRFVGVDVAEDAAAVAPYVEQHAIPYTVLLDQNSQAAAAYAVEGFPTTYFLDATGHIVARQIGSLTTEQLQQYIEQLLVSRP